MKPISISARAVVVACLLSAAIQAGAVMMEGGQAAAAPRQTPRAVPAASAATMELIAGIVSSVDPARTTMTVSGQVVTWHAAHLRVFAPNGGRAGERDVQAGMRVRFALEPSAGASAAAGGTRRVVLIYLDGRS